MIDMLLPLPPVHRLKVCDRCGKGCSCLNYPSATRRVIRLTCYMR